MFKNYRPVSLLPTCGKIFECLVDSEIYLVFSENDYPEAIVCRSGADPALVIRGGGDLIQKFSCEILGNLKQASIFVVPKNVLFFRGSTFL